MNSDALERRMTILLLGADDMDQTAEAAHAIDREHRWGNPNLQLIRALETAVVVCYWRPFSQSNSMGHLRAKDALDASLHKTMERMRNSVCPHRRELRSNCRNHVHTTTEGVQGLAFTDRQDRGHSARRVEG
jgi:hypothetical protein